MSDLYTLRKQDVPRAREVLKDAFRHDPVWNKLFEGQQRKEVRLSAFFETPIRYSLRYGQVAATSVDLEGVAAWVPGRHAGMSVWGMILSGAMACGMRIGMDVMRKMWPALTPIERDRRQYMRSTAFTYLQIIGVGSQHQGKGFGGRLLRAIIAESERNGHHLYLETETEENVRLYERFGFRVVKKLMLPGLELPMWEMEREPAQVGREASSLTPG